MHGKPEPDKEEHKRLKIQTIDMVKTGQNIVQLRLQAGLTVKDLQTIFGFATPQHSTAMPTVDNLVVLAAVFQVHIDDILAVDTNMQMKIGA